MSFRALAALPLVLLAARPALAMNVGVNFSGSVSQIVAFDFSTGAPPLLATEIGASVAVGTRFSGSFNFDDAAPGSGGVIQTTYSFRDPSWSFRTVLGDYAPGSDPAGGYDLSVHDGDYYGYGVSLAGGAHSPSGAGASSLDSLTQNLALYSNSPDLLSSTALDAVPWELAAYSQGGRMTWTFLRGNEYVAVSGTLDSLSLASVPEPALGGLVALGILGVAALGFRRARS